MNLFTCKIDSKGRIQLPRSFMMANDIDPGATLIFKPYINNKDLSDDKIMIEVDRREQRINKIMSEYS